MEFETPRYYPYPNLSSKNRDDTKEKPLSGHKYEKQPEKKIPPNHITWEATLLTITHLNMKSNYIFYIILEIVLNTEDVLLKSHHWIWIQDLHFQYNGKTDLEDFVVLLGPFTFLFVAFTNTQLHTPTWHFAGVVFWPFLIWTWTGVFSSTWTCKGGDEERFFMALLPQTEKGNTMKGNLWIRKLEITTFPSVLESNNGQPWLVWAFSSICHFELHTIFL